MFGPHIHHLMDLHQPFSGRISQVLQLTPRFPSTACLGKRGVYLCLTNFFVFHRHMLSAYYTVDPNNLLFYLVVPDAEVQW